MNFRDLQERCWVFLGLHDSTARPDWRRQLIRDYINDALMELTKQSRAWFLQRESSLSLVAGTSLYTLSDWCKRPLELWTTGSNAHKCYMSRPRIADRTGLRNDLASSGSLGPYNCVWYPRNDTAALSGTAASVSAGNGTVKIVSKTGGADWTTALCVNRLMRLKGHEYDYKVVSVENVNSLTLDRCALNKLEGEAVTNTPAAYSAVKWEIGPPHRFRLSLLPAPTVASTLYYRGLWIPRRLLHDDEVPEIADEYHDVVWKGALKMLGAFNEDDGTHQRYAAEFERAVQILKENDNDDQDSEDGPYVESSLDEGRWLRLPNDVYRRNGGNL